MRGYDSAGAGLSFSVRTSTGMASHSAALARSENARASISVPSISDSYKRAMAKVIKSSENNAVRTGSIPVNCCALLRATLKT